MPKASPLGRLARQIAKMPQRMSRDGDLAPPPYPAPSPRVQSAKAPNLCPAEVLLGVSNHTPHPSVLFTIRAATLTHHPGEISFPGGRREISDPTIGSTALRETHEEIGLHPENIRIVAHLPAHETISKFLVTPILAEIDAFTPRLSREVQEIFFIPLAYLLDPTHYRIETRLFGGQERRYYVIPYGAYYIWGATARILYKLATLEEHNAA